MSISASAPGKVLICGGYLVVESPNVGLSIGVNARFKTELKEAKLAPEAGDLIVKVASPQFGADFTFVVTNDGASVTVKQTEGRETPFLYCAVLVTTSFLLGVGGLPSGEVSLALLADNDFYSQRNFLEGQGKKVSAETLRGVPPHNPLVGDVSKTGLGSSAALTTSLVACVATALARASGNAAAQEVVKATETLHRLAQAAHSIAQGKIGSGFDVFTAVYGTSVYVRFQPSCVDTLMSGSVPTTLAAKTVTDCVDLSKAWVPERPVHVAGLPPGVKLLLADIHQGGSSTPGMVSKIMAWRKSVASEAGNLWDRLGAANQAYLATMVSLHAAAAAEATRPQYDATVAKLAGVPAVQWEAAADDANAALFVSMRDGASQTRGMLREVGEAAGVEVEPPTLTPLLDATRALPGVVAAGCPGAGGYDAVFALVLGDDVASAVEKFWEGYGGLEVCPLLVREDAQGLVVNAA